MVGKYWTGQDLEGSSRGLIEVSSSHLPVGTATNYETCQEVGIPAENRTEHLPNTDLHLYSYTNLLDNNGYLQ
jgi:hypothetical protein